jgi:predicted ATP-grasp superfamily ATP-dependent carboligase
MAQSSATPLKTIATLLLLLLALPFNLAIVLPTLLWSVIFPAKCAVSTSLKTVLITGGKMTKALQLARSFHAAGHRVILIETEKYWLTGHQFSNAVDRFYTVPDPQKSTDAYIQALQQIVEQEKVNVLVPVTSPAESYYVSLAKPFLTCEVFHFDKEITTLLDDKFAFAEQARSLNLAIPKSFKITDPSQVLNFDFAEATRPYILKSIPYDSVRRLNLTKLPCKTSEETAAFVNSLPISEAKPWIMQEFISGQEFCTHSTLRNGELRLHCCCESSAFQVNYQNINHPQILDWVTEFAKNLNLTGQASFDFIQSENGEVYAIECNPRTHSAITMFYNHPQVAEAYLESHLLPEPLQPLATSKPTYWTYHELWRLLNVRSFQDVQTRLQILFNGKDAIFSVADPLPFLMVHHFQIPLLLLTNFWRGGGWIRIDFNIGKLVELGGD